MTNSYVKRIYSLLDDTLKNEKNCCTKGCSSCCYQQIEVMSYERDAIKKFVSKNLDNETKEKVKLGLIEWLDYFDNNTPNDKPLDGQAIFGDFGQLVAKKGLKCPFLIDNLCSIYEMRPTTCRIHYVETQPELCAKDRLRDSAPKGLNLRIQIMQMMKSLGELSIEPLAYVVKDEILPERTLKKIEKIILR